MNVLKIPITFRKLFILRLCFRVIATVPRLNDQQITTSEPEIMEINARAEDMVKKTVARAGNIGRVYVPKAWIGKKVLVILEEERKYGEKER